MVATTPIAWTLGAVHCLALAVHRSRWHLGENVVERKSGALVGTGTIVTPKNVVVEVESDEGKLLKVVPQRPHADAQCRGRMV